MNEYDESTQFGRLLIAAKGKYKEIRIPADLARHLNVAHQKLTNWKRRGLPAKMIDHLADEFDCNYKWLKTGEGDMRSKPIKFLSQDEIIRKDIINIVNGMAGRELLQTKSLLEIVKSPKEPEENKEEKIKNKKE